MPFLPEPVSEPMVPNRSPRQPVRKTGSAFPAKPPVKLPSERPPSAGRVLSPTPASDLAKVIKVPNSLQGLAHYDNGVLYVAQDQNDLAAVYAFEATLRRQKLFREKRAVSLADVKALREKAALEEILSPLNTDPKQSLARFRDLIGRADAMRATDIHLYIYENSHCVVKFRIDGYLRMMWELLPDVATAMTIAFYNIADGKNAAEWQPREICFARVKDPSVLPPGIFAIRFSSTRTVVGSMIALRMLPKTLKQGATLDDLGLAPWQLTTLRDMLTASSGLFVITGPTGAGKSTLLKYSLEWLHTTTPYYNTISVEDPAEYEIKGVQQIDVLVQDNEDPTVDERSKAWATVIATTLRLDPDRLMISEIRDGGAAIAGFRAAQTGHLTLSTLHTNEAWEAINRLVDLLREGGMLNPLSLLANTKNFIGATAQRLVPAACPGCKVPLRGNEDRIGGKAGRLYCDLVAAIDQFEPRAGQVFLNGTGCDICVPEFKGQPAAQRIAPGAGIFGRTMVLEIVKPSQRHLDTALHSGTPAARRQWLEEGGRLMIDHALEKVMAGMISPEVVRTFVGEIRSSLQIISELRPTESPPPIQPRARPAGGRRPNAAAPRPAATITS